MKHINTQVVYMSIAAALLAAAGAYLWFSCPCRTTAPVTSFEECVAAGYPVMESYPEQCNADGKTFVRGGTNDAIENPPTVPRDEIGDIHAPFIDKEFKEKIVYKMSGSVNETLLRDHCDTLGGTFNTCGSLCAEGEICAAVCALTCEF